MAQTYKYNAIPTVVLDHVPTSSVASSPEKTSCFSLKNLITSIVIIGFGSFFAFLAGGSDGVVVVVLMYTVGTPMLYLILRYIWLRLCRDPFLSKSDNLIDATWESATTCPPSLHRTVPTLLYWFFILLCFVGAYFGSKAKDNSLEPNMFIVITYSGLGSFLILISAIWLVDALCLIYLFVVADKIHGHEGAAQDWWYRNTMAAEPSSSRDSVTTVSSNNSETSSQEFFDADTEKLCQMDDRCTGAKWRLLLIISLYTWWTVRASFAAYNPSILELNIPVPKLPPQCDGYRLAMASDLHIGTMSGLSDAQWMVDNLNALNPDVITLVGDIGDKPVSDMIRQKMAPIAGLKAPDGVFMTFGNHENLEGVEAYRKLLREESPFAENIVLLENQHALLDKGNTDGCSIALFGMADWSGNARAGLFKDQVAPDFDMALRSRAGHNGANIVNDEPVSSQLPMIMMQHQPHGMKVAAKNGIGLQLSGHTHGGQIFPQHVALLAYDAIAGLVEFDVGSEHGPSYLFVSEGVVGWGPRLRFLSQTDIALLTLRTPEAMKADGLEPDLNASVATIAMYFVLCFLPVSLVLCLVPACCWARQWRDRRSDIKVKVLEDLEEGDVSETEKESLGGGDDIQDV